MFVNTFLVVKEFHGFFRTIGAGVVALDPSDYDKK